MALFDNHLSKLQVLKFLQAVNDNDEKVVTKLVERGIPDLVNCNESTDGQYGLHLAACANSLSMIKTLLHLGADCNVVNKSGRTPFIQAAEYGHLEALQILLDSCKLPDLSTKDTSGRNILHHCLHGTKRHQLCLETALRYGANIHNVGHDGKSLIMRACEDNLETALKTFLEAGVDVNRQSQKTGETALHISCSLGYVQCTRLLLQHYADPNIVDDFKQHPAHRASKNGHLSILRLLSAYNAKFDDVDLNNNTLMHYAATAGNADLCKFLGQRGCPPTIKNSYGKVPKVIGKDLDFKDVMKECKKAEKYKGIKPGTQFHIVKFYDWVSEMQSLLEADVHEYDEKRSGKIRRDFFLTVLLARKPALEENEIRLILNQHDVQKTGKIDYTLFFSGKKYINKQYLINAPKKKKKGGQGRRKGKKGKTKVDMPICTNNDLVRSKDGGPLINYVEQQEQVTDKLRFDRDHQPLHPIQDDSLWYCYVPDTKYVHLHEVIKYDDKESLKAAIRNGLDINQVDKYYKTPLMLACLEGNYNIAKFLVDYGSDVSVVDNFKWTALHFACHIGQKDIVELLINKGAVLDAQSLNGGTPIMRAIETSKVQVVEYLIQHGAKLQIKNKKGETALDIAIAFADPRIIEIVQTRWDQLPPPIDKRKKGKSTNKKNGVSKSLSRISIPSIRIQQDPPQRSSRFELPPTSSILRTASTVANGASIGTNIKFTPKKAWLPQANTEELLAERKIRRERFGYEVDFEDYKPPYEKHIENMVGEIDDIIE